MSTRKDKLIALRKFIDLETGDFILKNTDDAFLYPKQKQKNILDNQIRSCRRCTGLNIPSCTKAVPAHGNLNSKIFFIGESPCIYTMQAQMQFAHKSGIILDIILALSNLDRYDVCMSDSIHCHPPRDRQPTPQELKNCRNYLRSEIHLVKPKLIIPLGNHAKETLAHIATDVLECKIFSVRHPASFLYNPRGMKDYILKVSFELDKYKDS